MTVPAMGLSEWLDCTDDGRRAAVRAAGHNGIDSIDVSRDQLTLTVMLLGKAPRELAPGNFRIDGGRRVTDIVVTGISLCVDADPELTDCLRLTVDRPGDYSDYRLCIVHSDRYGRPTNQPYPGFDPRFACMTFSFKQNCAAPLDCVGADDCPPDAGAEPVIDYLAKDYASFRQLLLDRLSLTMPAWTERHVPDIGIALVELLAATGDRLSYRQDAVATEAYLDTARLRVSVRRHARLVDYRMHDGCSARAWVRIETDEQLVLAAGDFRFAALPADLSATRGPAMLSADVDALDVGPFEVFEPLPAEEITLYPAHNRISIWTWGKQGCCLPAGSVSATLTVPESGLQLQAGDVLIFREILGARTGTVADADPAHCQAVRLTATAPTRDELYEQALLEVSWEPQDALGFDLCVTARCGPGCDEQEIGVAHGNVVLVDHGRTNDWCRGTPEPETVPPARTGDPGCPPCADFGCGCDEPVDGPAYPPDTARFGFTLLKSPVAQVSPFPGSAQVARAQADELAGLPGRARRRLNVVAGGLADGPLTAADLAYLNVLFGKVALDRLDLAGYPAEALAVLSGRFDELLAGKLERLAELVRRARAGYVLDDADEGWEVGATWGADERHKLDPTGRALRGPASSASAQDPRDALPAVRIFHPAEPAEPWQPCRDLLHAGPQDRLFVGEMDDDGNLAVRFGDGRSGLAPAPGSNLMVSYRTGNGRSGNVGRNAINTIVFCATRQGGISAVSNPLPATGGTDPEPVAVVRQLAPLQPNRILRRAITTADYAAVAGLVPGVQRAAADLRWTGSWYEMQVAIDPFGADRAPDELLDAVRQYLHQYRRIGHDLTVGSAQLVPLDLGVRVDVNPDRIAGHVRSAVLSVLGSKRSSDGRLGFFHPDNLTFGTPIRLSRLVAAVAAVPGVRHVEVTRLQPLFGPPGTALTDGILPLGPLQVAQLDNDPGRPENGRLTLTIAGGR